MGTEDNKFNQSGNRQQGNGQLQHNDTHSINESSRNNGRIEETNVTQNPPKPRGN